MAPGRGVGGASPGASVQAAGRRQDRLFPRHRRLEPRAGQKGGSKTGPSPVDRARAGSKHHLITDATGVPLAAILTAANVNDVTQLLALVDGVAPIGGGRGRPRRRPDTLVGDRGYDSDPHRKELRARGITPAIARRKTDHGSGLGTLRWPVERSLSWLHQFRKLLVRFERTAEMHEALLALACSVICFRKLQGSF